MRKTNNYESGISLKALILAILIIVILAGITIGSTIQESDNKIKREEVTNQSHLKKIDNGGT